MYGCRKSGLQSAVESRTNSRKLACVLEFGRNSVCSLGQYVLNLPAVVTGLLVKIQTVEKRSVAQRAIRNQRYSEAVVAEASYGACQIQMESAPSNKTTTLV